jgi:hypothetical protein
MQVILRFAPALWALAITIALVRCEWTLENRLGLVRLDSIARSILRLTPEVMLLAYLFAFVTPLYASIRVVIVAISPLVALVAILVAPLVHRLLGSVDHPSAAARSISNFIALLAVMIVLCLAHRIVRRARIPLGPFTLARI